MYPGGKHLFLPIFERLGIDRFDAVKLLGINADHALDEFGLFESRWWKRAVGKDASRTLQAQLADGEQIPFDLHLRESP